MYVVFLALKKLGFFLIVLCVLYELFVVLLQFFYRLMLFCSLQKLYEHNYFYIAKKLTKNKTWITSRCQVKYYVCKQQFSIKILFSKNYSMNPCH